MRAVRPRLTVTVSAHYAKAAPRAACTSVRSKRKDWAETETYNCAKQKAEWGGGHAHASTQTHTQHFPERRMEDLRLEISPFIPFLLQRYLCRLGSPAAPQ